MSNIKTLHTVGINGMGRIGRMLFRKAFSRLNIVAINGTSSAKQLAYFLKYDSVHGTWDKSITVKDSSLIIDGKTIACFKESHPDNIPWDKYQIDLVLECTGKFKNKSDWSQSFNKTVKKVLVSAPATDPDFTLVYGVNQQDYKKDKHHFISAASCTTNCLAPVIHVLNKFCGVNQAFFSTIHAYTNDQKLLDSSHAQDLRRSRAAGLNIIPTSTGAGSALSLVMPHVKNSITGIAFRVPTANVSLLDLVVSIKKPCSVNHIHQAFKQASDTYLKGIVSLEQQALVSSDFIGRTESSIIDSSLTSLQNQLLKLVVWYDNEVGFSQRMIDFIHDDKF